MDKINESINGIELSKYRIINRRLLDFIKGIEKILNAPSDDEKTKLLTNGLISNIPADVLKFAVDSLPKEIDKDTRDYITGECNTRLATCYNFIVSDTEKTFTLNYLKKLQLDLDAKLTKILKEKEAEIPDDMKKIFQKNEGNVTITSFTDKQEKSQEKQTPGFNQAITQMLNQTQIKPSEKPSEKTYESLLSNLMKTDFKNKYILSNRILSNDNSSFYLILIEILKKMQPIYPTIQSANIGEVNDLVSNNYTLYYASQMNRIKYLKSLVRQYIIMNKDDEDLLMLLAGNIGESNLGIPLVTLLNFSQYSAYIETEILKHYGGKNDTVYSIYKIFKNPPKELLNGNEFIRIPFMSRKQFEIFLKKYDIKLGKTVTPYISNEYIAQVIGNYVMTDFYSPSMFDLQIYSFIFNIKFYLFTSRAECACIKNFNNDEYFRTFIYYNYDTTVYSIAKLTNLEYNISYDMSRSFQHLDKNVNLKNTNKIYKEYINGYIFIDYIMCGLSEQLF